MVSLVIALDRSYSMFEARFGGGASRMSVLAQSLRGALAKQPGHLLVGYQEFPGNKQVCDDHSCCVGKVVPPNLVTAFLSIVDNRLLRCDSCLETSSDSPAHLAIKEAADELGLPGRLPTGPKHILLITDGDPTCQGKNQCQAALSEVSRAASADIKTTVLALVDDPKNTCLDEVALAGGGVLPASGALPFFAATSEGQIQQQVQDVVASLSQRPCRVQLDMPSPNPDRVTVRMDGKSVVRDANRLEGWNFEGTSNRTIRFYGTTCDRYRSRQVPDPDIVQPCFRCGNTRPVCR